MFRNGIESQANAHANSERENMKILIWPLALILLAGMAYSGYGNYQRSWTEEKIIELWVKEMTDEKVAGFEIMLDTCKIQLMPTLGKVVAKYKTVHAQSVEEAKFKTHAELISNPFFSMVKNMCPLIQQEMDTMQQKTMDALRKKLAAS
jgi:hypothetical protein